MTREARLRPPAKNKIFASPAEVRMAYDAGGSPDLQARIKARMVVRRKVANRNWWKPRSAACCCAR